MKFAENVLEVERSGVGVESKFSMKNTRKMFSVFFDHLYSNKIRAIIRELYSNAYDSHVCAGKLDVQPILHLPTAFEPSFVIRDFGTGLHPEDIAEIYTVVFESTKTGNNNEIGGFGLGSKTPFCYTDNFVVRSFFEGRVYVYNMNINEQGEPAYTLVSSEETTEPDGLEVKIAVVRADFKKFENETVEALQHFPLKPRLTGAKVVWPTITKVLEGLDWYMTEHKTYYGSEAAKPTVMVGPVAYPLDVSSFKDSLREAEKAAAASSITLKVGIGDVEVSPNREMLSYTIQTIDTIKKALKAAVDELTKRVEDKLLTAKNSYEKKALYIDVITELNLSGASNCIDTYKIFGHNVSHSNIGLNDIRKKGLGIVQFVPDSSNGCRQVNKVESLKPSLKVKFYYDDGVHAPHSRCEFYVKNNKDEKILLIKGPQLATLKKEFADLMGFTEADILPVSQLHYDKPVVVKSATGVKKYRAGLAVAGNYKFQDCDADASIEAYYVVIRHTQVYGDDNKTKNVSERNFFRFLSDLKDSGIILDRPLYGLRTDAYNKLKDNAKWKNLFAHLQSELSGKLTVNTLWANYDNYERLYGNIKKVLPNVDVNSEFAKAGKILMDAYEIAEKQKKFSKIIDKVNNTFIAVPTSSSLKTHNYSDEFKTMLGNKYPILKEWNVLEQWMDGKIGVVSDYIKLIG